MNKLYELVKMYCSGALYEPVRRRIDLMLPLLNERQRRLYLACEARAIGAGGIAAVNRLTGVSADTIAKGLKELGSAAAAMEPGRSRNLRNGRKGIKERRPDVLEELKKIIEKGREGKGNLLHYSGKSAAGISAALKEKGLAVSRSVTGKLLKEQGYSLRKTRKKQGGQAVTESGAEAQFQLIDRRARSYVKRGEAVVVMEAKAFAGRGGRANGAGLRYDQDCFERELGQGDSPASRELFRRGRLVNAGLDRGGARMAIERLGSWFETERCFEPYRGTERLLVIADFCGGSEWASLLGQLADRTRKKVTALHFPPGISRWEGVVHRFYAFVSDDREGRSVSGAVIVRLIVAGGDTGLTVECHNE